MATNYYFPENDHTVRVIAIKTGGFAAYLVELDQPLHIGTGQTSLEAIADLTARLHEAEAA